MNYHRHNSVGGQKWKMGEDGGLYRVDTCSCGHRYLAMSIIARAVDLLEKMVKERNQSKTIKLGV